MLTYFVKGNILNIRFKIFFAFIFIFLLPWLISLPTTFAQVTCGQSCDTICNVGQSGTQTACCGAPYQYICFSYTQEINNAYCSDNPVFDSCAESDVTNACPGGLPPVVFNGNWKGYAGGFCSSEVQVCNPYVYCGCYKWRAGDCSSSPVEQNYCDLISPLATYKGVEHACTGIGTGDLTVEIGQTFDLGYTYLGTGPTYVPWEVRTIMRGPQGVPPTETLNCVYNEDETAGVWHATNKAGITCPATPGTYDYTIRCKAAGSSSIVFCGQFDDSLGCRVKCVAPPISLGYLKLYHQGLGTIKLNLIKASDALLKSPFPGMVKVAMFNGDINSAADLVATNDPNASPVRIYTGLGGGNGIWAWKKLP